MTLPARLRRSICWMMVLLAATAVWAAEKKPPKITLTKTDNTVVIGEFVEATPVAMTVSVKASAKADPAPVVVPWSEIRKTSNGLTRQKVVDDWKTTHADQLCDTCHGDGTDKCETCKGSGVDPAQAKPCDKCKGTGNLGKCPTCKATGDGKVPCPANCLKPPMFVGIKPDAEGRRMKMFRNKDGSSIGYSEHHIGELMAQENGQWQNKGKCPTCAGTTWVICATCHGTSQKECPTCHGGGQTGPACTAGCKAGRVDCKTCTGTGLKASAAPASNGT